MTSKGLHSFFFERSPLHLLDIFGRSFLDTSSSSYFSHVRSFGKKFKFPDVVTNWFGHYWFWPLAGHQLLSSGWDLSDRWHHALSWRRTHTWDCRCTWWPYPVMPLENCFTIMHGLRANCLHKLRWVGVAWNLITTWQWVCLGTPLDSAQRSSDHSM